MTCKSGSFHALDPKNLQSGEGDYMGGQLAMRNKEMAVF